MTLIEVRNRSSAKLACHCILYDPLRSYFVECQINEGRRSTNHPNRPCKSGKIKVNEQKSHSAFLCAEHFYFQDRHIFSCVGPLFLCYKVLNMGSVALF